jgi:hypothetical protein
MLRKENEIKWDDDARKYFITIKYALTEAPVLASLDFSKDFLTFSYASEDTIAVVLLQRNAEGYEQPISFYTRALRDVELKYSLVEKQAYALVKALKSFRVYILHSKIIVYVPNTIVKDVLMQSDIEGKRGRWITKIMEFDIKIKLTKLIKGQGLARLMADSNCKALNLSLTDSNILQADDKVIPYSDLFESPWYQDIVYFLQNLSFPLEMEKSKKRALKLKAIKYCIIGQELYWKYSLGLLLQCLNEDESQRVMT